MTMHHVQIRNVKLNAVSAVDYSDESLPENVRLAENVAVALPELERQPSLQGRRVQQLGKAAKVSLQRKVHTAMGLGSLLLGGIHLLNLMLHGFSVELPQQEILLAGTFHILTALMGLPRINWADKKEAARNIMIGPVPIQNIGLIWASLSEWTQGSDAVLSMYSEPFAAFAILNVCIALWQTCASNVSSGASKSEQQKTGIWFGNASMNALVTLLTYTGIFIAFFSEPLFIRQTIDIGAQCNFAASHPEYSNILGNILLNSVFFNNFAVFEATLVKYKVLTPTQAATIYLPLQVAVIIRSLSSFLLADGGQSPGDLVHFLASGGMASI